MEYPHLTEHEKALHFAAEKGDLEAVKNLLIARSELGLEINRKDPENLDSTALHLAAKSGHDEICHYLMMHGGCIYWRNRVGHTPAFLAREAGFDTLADKLRAAERQPPKMLEEFFVAFLPEKLVGETAA